MRHAFAGVLVLMTSALPLSAALDFNSGNFGTVGIGNTIFLFTPTGGTGPYVFSYTPTATPIPNFRVINAPEIPSFANASQTGGLAGIPLTGGVQSTSIRLTDTGTGLFVDKAVSFTVTTVDLIGYSPNYYSIGDTVSQVFWPVGGTPPYSYTLGGTAPPGLSLATQTINGENVAVITGTIAATANTATTTASNQYSFNITIHDSAGNSLVRGFGMAVSAMQLSLNGAFLNSGSNRDLPVATVGLAYNEQINVTGGTPPYTFSLLPLNAPPNPLTLSSSGLISGTPTGSNFSGRFTMVVTDAANHYMQARLALKILPVIPVPLGFSTTTLSDSPVGSNFDFGVYATGGLPPYTFDVEPTGPLPPGAVLVQGPTKDPTNDPDPGYLRLKVQTPGSYTFTIGVTDTAGDKATHALSMNVPSLSAQYIYAPTAVNTGPLSDLVLGVPYSRYLIPLGGTPPYTTTPINIPYGLTVNNADLLSGTPLEAGANLPLNYNLADSAGNHFLTPGNVTIASTTTPGLALSGGDLGVVQIGSQFATNLTVSGSAQNLPTFTVTQVAGTIPPGLSLLTGPDFNNGGNPTVAAQLAGIPNTPGVYTFVYRVVDGLGQVGEREVKLRVSGMAIVNTAFAPGTIGVPYTQTIDVRGGTPPYTFSLTTGSLPPNLQFNTTTGTISGTPLSTNSTGVTIQVQDTNGDTLLRGFTLNIYEIRIPDVVGTAGPDVLPTAVFGQPYSYTFTPTPPGTYTFTASGLPSGLAINSSTGVVSGIVLGGTSYYLVSVTAYNNATGAVVSRSFSLWETSQQNLPILLGLPTAELDIAGVPTAYLGEVNVGTNTVFTLGTNSGTPPYTISVVPPSALPPGLAMAVGSVYQGTTNFDRWTIAGVPTTPGIYTFTLRYADSAGITHDRVVALNVTKLGLATTTPGIAYVNQPYSAQLYGTGGTGPYTFAVATDVQSNLMPPGLNISSTGAITGIPTSTGAYGVTLQLTSGAATRRVGITITINANSANQRIDFPFGGPVPNYVVQGRGFSSFFSPSGGAASGAYTWSIVAGSLPPGMQLSTNGSLISQPGAALVGAPTAPGTYNFRIRVNDSTGNFGLRDAMYIVTPLRVTPVNAPFFASTSLPPGQVGSAYSFSVSALNAGSGLTWVQEIGTLLPPGVSFSSAGVFSGTPTAAGQFVLFGHATDSSGSYFHFGTNLSVFPSGRPIGMQAQAGTGTLLPSATVGGAFSLTLNDLLSPNWGNPPFTWTLNDGTLPPGVQIVPGSGSASATLSGTATTPGTYIFSLLASDSLGNKTLIKNLEIIASVLGVNPSAGALPPAIAGVSYQTSMAASGGTPPYNFTTEFDSDMPSGLSLSPGGVLSGVPAISGPFVLYVIVTDGVNNTFRQRYTLNVSPAGTATPSFVLTPASINITYTVGDPAPAPIPISVTSTATPLSYTISAGNLSWLSSSAAGGTTPGAPNAIITPGMTAGVFNGNLTFTSSAASNSPANLPVTLTIVNAVVCSYSLSQTASTIAAAGGTLSFSVAVPSSSCAWSVDTVDLPSWIHLTSPSSGTGNGTLTFTVDANGPAPVSQRIGVILVNGLSYTLTQFGSSCSFDLATQTVNIPTSGGAGPIGVIASAGTCSWSVTQVDPWIVLTSTLPNPSKGNGTANLTFQPNTLPTSRTGTMTIAGQTLTVNQPGVGCVYSLNSSGTSVSSAGGPASFNVTVPGGCAWTADTGPSWITATSGTPGNGNGTVNLTVAPNSTSTQRSAMVKVAGVPFTITQAGVPCDFTLIANNPIQPMAGGGGSVAISTGGSCNWTASLNGANWVTAAAGSGTGSTTLNFSVGVNNTGAARSATLTIAGQNIIINQNGPACSYALQSTSATVPGAGGAGTVGVITAGGCGPWTGMPNVPWLHYTGLASDNGPDTASYTVDPNLTGADRFGALTIAGQTFAVTEPAQPCPVTLGTSSLNGVGEFGGGPFQFVFTTTPPGCAVNIVSYSSWITIADLSTPGTVGFSVAPNTYAAARSGTIIVGDQTFTVNQAPSTCGYTLTSFAASPVFGLMGGSGVVPMSFAPAQCGPPPVIVNGPAGMITLGAVTGGAGSATPSNYFQNYSVAIYLSFINYVQTAQILIDGQIYTVKQNSW